VVFYYVVLNGQCSAKAVTTINKSVNENLSPCNWH